MMGAVEGSPLNRGRGATAPRLVVLTTAAIAGVLGAGLLGWAIFSPQPVSELPYEIKSTDSVADLLSDAQPTPPEGFGTQSYAVHVEGVSSPIAEFVTLTKGDKPHSIFYWRNSTNEPALSPDLPAKDTNKLAEAITKYTTEDDVLIGFPGVVTAVATLAGRDALISGGAPEPLLLPSVWEGQRDQIVKHQAEFWKFAQSSDQNAMLNKLAGALLSDELTGAATLAALAKGRRAFLIVHIGDLLRLGRLAPQRLQFGYKDFPGADRGHGLIKSVKSWLVQNRHESYAIEPRDGGYSRVYFLEGKEVPKSLIAQALPFSTSNPMQLKVLRLVYQSGGAWIYKIEPLQQGESDNKS